MSVLLTVPHCLCLYEGNKNHLCDSIALKAAKNINKNNGFTLIKGNISRDKCDLNRINCRDTYFRKEIMNLIDKYKIKWVIDIHSFPEVFLNNFEIYILDDYTEEKTNYCVDFYKYILKNNVNCGYFQGIDNDIMDQTREKGVKSFLIEFNESLSKNRLNEICSVVASFF